MPSSENTDSTCLDACPEGMIIDKDNKLCYATKAECKTVISSDTTNCIADCSSDSKETAISMNNGEYSQCTACTKYYVPAAQAAS